jgi:hypothetical protein
MCLTATIISRCIQTGIGLRQAENDYCAVFAQIVHTRKMKKHLLMGGTSSKEARLDCSLYSPCSVSEQQDEIQPGLRPANEEIKSSNEEFETAREE